jgi:sec-independent protein translocase protein TatA
MFMLFGWTPGWMELTIIAFIALLLFGHRLPSVMRSMGSGINEFKKGMAEGDQAGEGDKMEGKSV